MRYHITAPEENGAGAAHGDARGLEAGGLRPDQIDYINAHGTSTPLNDKSETAAIKTVLGEAAYHIPISSTKSMTGHLLGAAGAIEAVFCLKVIDEGIIPPTINYEHPDPECDLDYVPNTARQKQVERGHVEFIRIWRAQRRGDLQPLSAVGRKGRGAPRVHCGLAHTMQREDT